MKFKLFGDLDCPDWILAEIAPLSRLTSIKLKILSVQVMKELQGGKIDYEKLNKLTSEPKFDIADLKASIAALSHIFSSASKYDTEETILMNELQQLGLPKEHSTAICRVYGDNHKELKEYLKNQSLRLSHLEDVQWRVDYVIGSSYSKNVNEPLIHLNMKIKNDDTLSANAVAVTMTDDDCRILLHELKEAYKIMEGLS